MVLELQDSSACNKAPLIEEAGVRKAMKVLHKEMIKAAETKFTAKRFDT